LPRDLFYGIYTLVVAAFVFAWARDSGLSQHDFFRHWRAGVALGVLAAASLILLVSFREDATSRPSGVELVAAVAWRGVVYGVTDPVLLTVFPVLAVFAAFRDRRTGLRPTILVGLVALLASLAITATYHLGYADFRSDKVRKPLTGDLIWTAPTLLTLSPLGAPIAHAGLHVSAVLHSYETETFLPPHSQAR